MTNLAFTASRRTTLVAAVTGLGVASAGCALRAPVASRAELLARVRAAEEGFAVTMARRDAAAIAAGRWLVMFDNSYRLCAA